MNYDENLLKSKETDLSEKIIRIALILSLYISITAAMLVFIFNPISIVSGLLFIIQGIALFALFYFIVLWTKPKNQEDI